MARPPKDPALIARGVELVRAGKSPQDAALELLRQGFKIGYRTIYRAIGDECRGRRPRRPGPGEHGHVSDVALYRAVQFVDQGHTIAAASRMLGGKPSPPTITKAIAWVDRMVALSRRPLGAPTCAWCRVPFEPSGHLKVTCSRTCSAARMKARNLQRSNDRYEAKREAILDHMARKRGGKRAVAKESTRAP